MQRVASKSAEQSPGDPNDPPFARTRPAILSFSGPDVGIGIDGTFIVKYVEPDRSII